MLKDSAILNCELGVVRVVVLLFFRPKIPTSGGFFDDEKKKFQLSKIIERTISQKVECGIRQSPHTGSILLSSWKWKRLLEPYFVDLSVEHVACLHDLLRVLIVVNFAVC